MSKQTLIITSAVLATALILSGVSVANDDARGHGLIKAREAAGTHGKQGRCNAASHQNITLNGCANDPLPPPPPTTEPPYVPPPTTEPPYVPPPTTEPLPPIGG